MRKILGKIDLSKLTTAPEKHELAAAEFLAAHGYDIEFIRPSNRPGQKTADLILNHVHSVPWELKCPKGSGSRTLEKIFRVAVKQSKYIIVDIRGVGKIPDKKCVAKLEKEFYARKYLKRLLIITKARQIIDLSQ